MLAFLKDWIINIVALVLFITLVEILLPSGRIKKYANLVTGFILIIAIISPFVRFLGGEFRLEDYNAFNSNMIDRAEIERNSRILKEDQMKEIVALYRQKVIKQLEESAMDMGEVTSARADVIINEDYDSDDFGKIKRAYIEIGTEAGDKKIKPFVNVDKVKKVEKVSIDAGSQEPNADIEAADRTATGMAGAGKTRAGDKGTGETAAGSGVRTDLKKKLEDRIGSRFDIDAENIIIMKLEE